MGGGQDVEQGGKGRVATAVVPRRVWGLRFRSTGRGVGGGRTLNHPFMGVSKLPHKTCPFSLQVSVNRSVHPTCLRYRSSLYVQSEQIGMENRRNFIPTPEFLKSEIGIPIKRNFPAGIGRLGFESLKAVKISGRILPG